MGLNYYRKWLHPEPKGYVRSYGLLRINHRIKLWLTVWSIFVMFNFMDQYSWVMVLRYMVRHYSGCFCEWNLHVKQGTLSKVDWPPSWGSVSQFSRSVVSDSLWPHGLQHARPPCPSPTPGACSNSHPSSWWYHPPSHPLSFPFPDFNLSWHQGLFQWVSSSHQVGKVLELQLHKDRPHSIS